MADNQKHINNISTSLKEKVWEILETVSDPEVPVLSVIDLGIIRDVKISEKEQIEIVITPTYSGCPAMDAISMNIRLALAQNGFSNIKITSILSPAWTTDWISQAGKAKLKEYGIAPPVGKSFDQQLLENIIVQCPQCESRDTKLISEFSSTACKSFYICNHCKEPFEYFKCH